MNELAVNIKDLVWREHKATGKGLKSKLLLAEKGVKTILFKMPKGFEMKAHNHPKTEQHFVLLGKYKIGEKIFTSGTYEFIPAGTFHESVFSKSGATILIIRYPS